MATLPKQLEAYFGKCDTLEARQLCLLVLHRMRWLGCASALLRLDQQLVPIILALEVPQFPSSPPQGRGRAPTRLPRPPRSCCGSGAYSVFNASSCSCKIDFMLYA